MLEHLPEEVFTLKIKEMEFDLGSGEVSKVFVKKDGETLQLNHLNAGESGEDYRYIRRDSCKAKAERGKY